MLLTLVATVGRVGGRRVNVNGEHDDLGRHCAHFVAKAKGVDTVQIGLEGVFAIWFTIAWFEVIIQLIFKLEYLPL